MVFLLFYREKTLRKTSKIGTSEIFLVFLTLYLFSFSVIQILKQKIEKVSETKVINLGLVLMGLGTLGYSISFNKLVLIP